MSTLEAIKNTPEQLIYLGVNELNLSENISSTFFPVSDKQNQDANYKFDASDINNIKAFIEGNNHAILFLPAFVDFFKSSNTFEIQQLRNLLKGIFSPSFKVENLVTLISRSSIKIQNLIFKVAERLLDTNLQESLVNKAILIACMPCPAGEKMMYDSAEGLITGDFVLFEKRFCKAMEIFSSRINEYSERNQLITRIVAQNTIYPLISLLNITLSDKISHIDLYIRIYRQLRNSPYSNMLGFLKNPQPPFIDVGYSIKYLAPERNNETYRISSINTDDGLIYFEELPYPISFLEIITTSISIIKPEA